MGAARLTYDDICVEVRLRHSRIRWSHIRITLLFD